jgi:ribulose-5-phosphate 4-epimerase/fuculose-1-phosphate aldolase
MTAIMKYMYCVLFSLPKVKVREVVHLMSVSLTIFSMRDWCSYTTLDLTCELLSLRLGDDISYHDWGFSWISCLFKQVLG